MLLKEITVDWDLVHKKASILEHVWIAVPTLTLSQQDVHGVWLFRTFEDAMQAMDSGAVQKILSLTTTGHILICLTPKPHRKFAIFHVQGFSVNRALKWSVQNAQEYTLPILAISNTEKSARTIAEQHLHNLGLMDTVSVFKVDNLDTGIFDYTKQELNEGKGKGAEVFSFLDLTNRIANISRRAEKNVPEFKKLAVALFKEGFTFEGTRFYRTDDTGSFEFIFPDAVDTYRAESLLIEVHFFSSPHLPAYQDVLEVFEILKRFKDLATFLKWFRSNADT